MEVLYEFVGRVLAQIINPILLLLTAVAFVVFVWGVFEFILHADDDKKRGEGRYAIMWGLVGLVIIFGAYGIINVAQKTVFPGNPPIEQILNR